MAEDGWLRTDGLGRMAEGNARVHPRHFHAMKINASPQDFLFSLDDFSRLPRRSEEIQARPRPGFLAPGRQPVLVRLVAGDPRNPRCLLLQVRLVFHFPAPRSRAEELTTAVVRRPMADWVARSNRSGSRIPAWSNPGADGLRPARFPGADENGQIELDEDPGGNEAPGIVDCPARGHQVQCPPLPGPGATPHGPRLARVAGENDRTAEEPPNALR